MVQHIFWGSVRQIALRMGTAEVMDEPEAGEQQCGESRCSAKNCPPPKERTGRAYWGGREGEGANDLGLAPGES